MTFLWKKIWYFPILIKSTFGCKHAQSLLSKLNFPFIITFSLCLCPSICPSLSVSVCLCLSILLLHSFCCAPFFFCSILNSAFMCLWVILILFYSLSPFFLFMKIWFFSSLLFSSSSDSFRFGNAPKLMERKIPPSNKQFFFFSSHFLFFFSAQFLPFKE